MWNPFYTPAVQNINEPKFPFGKHERQVRAPKLKDEADCQKIPVPQEEKEDGHWQGGSRREDE